MKETCYRAGIYARLSVDSQDEKMESIETQVEAARQYMRTRPELRLCGCYTDAGKSGTGFDRQGFIRLMTDVRRGEINCILVRDFSRFGRNYIETGNYIQKVFPCMGVRFISIAEGYDSLNADYDELNMNLKNLVNELYARDISVKVKSSRRIMWEKGSYTGGIPPYGYQTGWAKERRCLFVDETASGVVKKIYDLYEAGRNRKQIARWLYEQGIHRPKDYRRYGHVFCQRGEVLMEWPSAGLRQLLENPVYTGCLARERSDGKEPGTGREESGWPEEWEVIENSHEAIITREQFFRIRKKLTQRAYSRDQIPLKAESANGKRQTDSNGRAVRERGFPESILFCGVCGKRMAAGGKKRGADGSGGPSCFYCRRSSRIDGMRCERAYLAQGDLMRIMKEGLKREFYLNGPENGRLSDGLDRLYEEERKKGQRQLAGISDRIVARKLHGSEQYRNFREGRLEREAFFAGRQETREALYRLRRERTQVEGRCGKLEKAYEELRRLFTPWIRQEESYMRTSDIQVMGKALIEEIRVFPDKRVEIIFRYDEPAFADPLWHVENTGGNCPAP